MPIASRSFRVVYQCYFQFFSTHSRSVRGKKKEKGKKEEVSAILGQASAAGRMVYPRPIRIHNEFDTVIEDLPELQICTICSYLPQIPRVLRNFRTTSKRFCSDLRECFQKSLLSRLARAPHPHLRLRAPARLDVQHGEEAAADEQHDTIDWISADGFFDIHAH